MAGDWIKIRVDLERDPKFLMMREELRVTLSDESVTHGDVTQTSLTSRIVLGLHRVWSSVRLRGKEDGDDALFSTAKLTTLDHIAEIPGFGKAMSEVGWVAENGTGLRFPNWLEDNELPQNTAKSGAQRMRDFRDRRKGKCDARDDRGEERREEKKTPPTPQGGSGGGLFDRMDVPKSHRQALSSCPIHNLLGIFHAAREDPKVDRPGSVIKARMEEHSKYPLTPRGLCRLVNDGIILQAGPKPLPQHVKHNKRGLYDDNDEILLPVSDFHTANFG